MADGIFTVGHGDILTEKRFGDFQLHLEFNVPYMPKARGQGRGNSGVYLDGIYELQVLDSYGLKPQNNDCGAIYKQIVPSVNACKPPLQWQTYDVTFHKAVVERGQGRQEGPRDRGPERHQDHRRRRDLAPRPAASSDKAGQDGPILLQDHGNPSSIAISGSSRSVARIAWPIREGEAPSERLLRLGRSLALPEARRSQAPAASLSAARAGS